MRVAFSILHFGPFEVTADCIQSLLRLDCIENNEIIVVDNGTKNGSYDKLIKRYSLIPNIHFVQTGENLGFAKGNNVGFRYAKDIIKADVVCVMNNDITIEQDSFITLLESVVNKNAADIIAPAIVDTRGSWQNPLRTSRLSNTEIAWGLIYNTVMYVIYTIPFINIKTAEFLENRRKSKVHSYTDTDLDNIVPHGAFVIFGPDYINNENNAFLENTFLFGEEDFLYEYANKKGYRILYTSIIKCSHHEDASIKAITKNTIEKRKFISKHKISSLIKLIHYRRDCTA